MSVYLFRTPTPSTITEWTKTLDLRAPDGRGGVANLMAPSFSSPRPMDPGDTVHLVVPCWVCWERGAQACMYSNIRSNRPAVVASSTVTGCRTNHISEPPHKITLAPVSLLEEPLTELPCPAMSPAHLRHGVPIPSLSPSEVQAWN